LKVNEPGLLANDTGTTPLVETSWGLPSLNPDPSDDWSLWGNAAIRYGNPTGTTNRHGGFTYTPDPDTPFSGIDQFDYWVIDACGTESLATAYITVVPTVVDSSYSTSVDTPLTVDATSGFLAHDVGVDPSSMFYDGTSAQGGTVDDSASADGSFVYTPPAGFVGADSFGYQVNDLNGDNTYYGTVHIQVGGPSAPTTVTATGGNHQATVTFAGATANGSPITSYTATASPGGQTVTGSSSPLVVSGLTNGTTYRFSVHASSADGPGSESAQSNAIVPDDGAPPVVAMTAPTGLVQLSTNVAAAWHGTDASGIARYDARRSITGWNGSPGAWTAWNASLTTATTLAGTYGRTYCFEARAMDNAGHLVPWTAPRCAAVPLRADQLAYSTGWSKTANASLFAGMQYSSKTHGGVMTRTGIIAKRISLVLTDCSTCGTVQVRWNGAVIANINTYHATSLHRQVVQVANWATARSGTITETVTSATGKTVAIEGLAIYNG
jgi:hypothetical protein